MTTSTDAMASQVRSTSRAIIVHPKFPLPKPKKDSKDHARTADWNLLPLEVLPIISAHLDARSLCSLACANSACRHARVSLAPAPPRSSCPPQWHVLPVCLSLYALTTVRAPQSSC